MDNVSAANASLSAQRAASAVKTQFCRKGCGDPITLVRSKTGKWYPANVLNNGPASYCVMPTYAAGGRHVHKCDGVTSNRVAS